MGESKKKAKICQDCGYAYKPPHTSKDCVKNLRRTADRTAMNIIGQVVLEYKLRGVLGLCKEIILEAKEQGMVGGTRVSGFTVENCLDLIGKAEVLKSETEKVEEED